MKEFRSLAQMARHYGVNMRRMRIYLDEYCRMYGLKPVRRGRAKPPFGFICWFDKHIIRGGSMGVKVVRFGEVVEKVGYREVELWPTSRRGLRMVYRDKEGNCFWFKRDGTKVYVSCYEEC